ncbi:hypothetical protein HDK90DRAFT_330635 [Phyllosticta capitalensis]|uniref:Uncharacterized protein n=1 Tax=Phyllosticta capitalensis TaxID=121624 RepID=A0ABR1YII5_9PEZI
MSHSQSSGALAQDMRQLSLSPDSDAHGETRTSTPNAIPIFYRLAMPPSDHPHQQQATNIIFVYRVVFSKAHAPGSPDGGTTTAMENARLYSKSLQRALMPLVFEHVGIPADGCGATTNGSDRIFSTRRLALGKVGVEGRKEEEEEEEEREDRVDFELDAPRGSGGRVGVVVELIDEALAPPATLGPEAAAASMSANQSQFLSSAVQAFARAQVWEGKDAVGGWRLVGKNMYFDATPEQCLGYGPFQARRGVAVPLTRDPQCLLKLAPLSRTFVVESPFVEFVERLVAPGEMRAVHSIPGDVVEYVKKVFTGSKVRYSYVSAAQREDGESRKAMRLQSWEVQKEGILRRICGFGGNAKDTKFQHIRKTAGEEEESLSVQEYFENHVFPGTKLRFPKWPLANTGSIEKPTWVPLELLWIEADQIVDELPERLPLIVSKLFTEKHADNIRKFDPESFTSLLKLDQVTAHYRIQLEETTS